MFCIQNAICNAAESAGWGANDSVSRRGKFGSAIKLLIHSFVESAQVELCRSQSASTCLTDVASGVNAEFVIKTGFKLARPGYY